jgi:hypothetical protein
MARRAKSGFFWCFMPKRVLKNLPWTYKKLHGYKGHPHDISFGASCIRSGSFIIIIRCARSAGVEVYAKLSRRQISNHGQTLKSWNTTGLIPKM